MSEAVRADETRVPRDAPDSGAGRSVKVRAVRQEDFAWLTTHDPSPAAVERESLNLLFCLHFAATSFVALDEHGEPCGIVLGLLAAGSSLGYVHHLYVEAPWRRRGVASRLLGRFEEAVHALGASEVTLFTAHAAAFYARHGYRAEPHGCCGAVASYIRDVKNVITMTKSL